MKDDRCWRFLLWALPQLGYDPAGFRKVRGQVCKRIARRLRRIGMPDLDRYRDRLTEDRDEWAVLDGFCRITVTRFCRERPMFARLCDDILPQLITSAERQGRSVLHAWSAGCGGGEEPYTLRILWDLEIAPRFPSVTLDIVATDADAVMLRRADGARYRRGTLREMPQIWIARAFETAGDRFYLRADFRHDIRFEQQDIRERMPDGPFDLVLCRYLVFTYFDSDGQRKALREIMRRMRPGGVLIVGCKERPPSGAIGIEPIDPKLGLWRHSAAP